MKKSIFLLGLLTIAGISLTACGSKNYEMSFDEALEIASHSALQDILTDNENVQQDFDITTDFNVEWTSIAADIQSSSKENTKTSKSDSSVKFGLKVNSEEIGDIKANWNVNIKLIDDMLYLSLGSLDVTWPEDVSSMLAMIDLYKDQWFSMSMDGVSEISNWYFKDLSEFNTQTKEIVNNEGSVVYEWKFSQFNWYNARKISLNNEKLQEIINEYFKSLNTVEDEETEIPQLNIENFEWYLVITWKDKVTIVVDNMDIVDEESTVNVNWFGGEDYAINLWTEWEDVITLTANKKWSSYDVALNISDMMSLNWKISPKVSKSSINIKFDTKLTIKGDTNDTIVPLKGSRSYEPISEFEVIAPENAQDINDLMGSYLGTMMWWDDYYDDYDYEDYDYNYEDVEDTAEVEGIEEVEAEVEAEEIAE